MITDDQSSTGISIKPVDTKQSILQDSIDFFDCWVLKLKLVSKHFGSKPLLLKRFTVYSACKWRPLHK